MKKMIKPTDTLEMSILIDIVVRDERPVARTQHSSGVTHGEAEYVPRIAQVDVDLETVPRTTQTFELASFYICS